MKKNKSNLNHLHVTMNVEFLLHVYENALLNLCFDMVQK